MVKSQGKPMSRKAKSGRTVSNSLKVPMVSKQHCKQSRSNPGPRRAGMKKTHRPKGKSASAKGKKVSTGVKRLDELLNGGVPLKSAILLYGDKFSGKDTLLNLMILSGLKQGAPGIILTNERTSSEVRRNLQAIMSNFTVFEKKGILKYIDAYTATVKLKGKNPFAVYIDPSKNPAEMKNGLSKVFEAFGKKYFYYRVMFDSLTPVLRKFGVDKTLGFLNLFLTKAKANNALVIFDLSEGVHQQSEITAIEEVMDGVIEFKSEAGRNFLRVKGLGEVRTRDWVEFKFSPSKFEVTGSFALQKIA